MLLMSKESKRCKMCEMMSKVSKEAFIVLIVTHVTLVERVERLHYVHNIHLMLCRKGQKIMLYVETRDKYIFAHNFLNIQPIFNPQKVLESWDLDLSNHTTQCYVCRRGRKLFWLLTPWTCFDIHSIGWYGWKGLSLSFPKLFADWKSVEY